MERTCFTGFFSAAGNRRVPIAQQRHQAHCHANHDLFNLLCATYGGDGVATFGVPDMHGRLPMHLGPQYPLGTLVGTETVTPTKDSCRPIPVQQRRSPASTSTSTACRVMALGQHH